MILTYKVKHGKKLDKELSIAKKIAEFALNNRDKLSSKHVTHLGLKSVIANQILRKYGRNKKANTVKSVKLTIPNQGIKYQTGVINIPSLKLFIPFNKSFQKINQIELDKLFAYISITVSEPPTIKIKTHIGVDLNTTGHCAVVAIRETGKVLKLGKKAEHIHRKYKNIRKNLQKKGCIRLLRKLKIVSPGLLGT